MPLDAQIFNTLKRVITRMLDDVIAESTAINSNVVTATQELTAIDDETGAKQKAYGLGMVLITTNEDFRDSLEDELHAWLVSKGFPRRRLR